MPAYSGINLESRNMTAHPLLADVTAFCARTGMAESTFGREAVNDWKFIPDLRGDNRPRPRRVWPDTEQRVRAFMREYEARQLSAVAA